jgi:hypothetical protein
MKPPAEAGGSPHETIHSTLAAFAGFLLAALLTALAGLLLLAALTGLLLATLLTWVALVLLTLLALLSWVLVRIVHRHDLSVPLE